MFPHRFLPETIEGIKSNQPNEMSKPADDGLGFWDMSLLGRLESHGRRLSLHWLLTKE